MSDKALQKSLEKSLSINSLDDLVRARTSEEAILLLDCSGSMDAYMRNGKRRIDGLRQVVGEIQAKQRCRMIVFGPPNADHQDVYFTEQVPDPDGSTPLRGAIELAAKKGAGRLVVISDGWPDERMGCMEMAKQFGGQIDVMYVGDPGDEGSAFLEELARTTGGSRFEGDLSEPKRISGAVIGLLAGEVMEEVPDEEDESDMEDEDGEEDEDTDDEF